MFWSFGGWKTASLCNQTWTELRPCWLELRAQSLVDVFQMIDPWTRVRTLHHVYLTPRIHVFPPVVHGSTSRDYTSPHRATSLDTRLWSIHTTCGYPPSNYVLAPHSFYNYIRIRTHHVSNQHVTVVSPDHRNAQISCCIVTVISPRILLCALAEHTEATFSPPTCASIISPIF
jgi:hypothetical protein